MAKNIDHITFGSVNITSRKDEGERGILNHTEGRREKGKLTALERAKEKNLWQQSNPSKFWTGLVVIRFDSAGEHLINQSVTQDQHK